MPIVPLTSSVMAGPLAPIGPITGTRAPSGARPPIAMSHQCPSRRRRCGSRVAGGRRRRRAPRTIAHRCRAGRESARRRRRARLLPRATRRRPRARATGGVAGSPTELTRAKPPPTTSSKRPIVSPRRTSPCTKRRAASGSPSTRSPGPMLGVGIGGVGPRPSRPRSSLRRARRPPRDRTRRSPCRARSRTRSPGASWTVRSEA